MSLSFLVPAFLAGLLALAVPIIIHLQRRDTREPVDFPSLMFVEKVPEKRTEKRQIHRWPLFLLRCAAILLVVLAFSRPFLEQADGAPLLSAGGDREVVVLLDRSFSMGYGDRWERAVAAATESVEDIGIGERGTVILFDSGAEAVTESTTDRNVLRAAIRSAEPGVRTTRYAPALRYAARIFSSSSLPRHELVVISDFQRGGWDADGGETSSLRLPPGTIIRPISVADGVTQGNVTVESAEFERTTVAGRERVTVVGRLTSNGPVPSDLPVQLEIDGRVVETRTASFGEGTSSQVSFAAITLPESGSTRGTLRIPDDGLRVDNAFHFVLSSDQRIGVLIVDGAGTSQGASYFLERALALGAAPGFRAEVRRTGEIRAADLVGNPVVILNQAGLPAGEQGQRLRTHVEQGGGLVFILGNNSLGDWQGVLPSIPAAVDRSQVGGVTMGYVDLGHPVFEPFAGPRSGDFSAARIYRYRPVPTNAFPRVLARYGDGGSALLERAVGEGRVLVWTSTLDSDWNDVTVQPIFLPFVHQLVKYAAGYTPPRSAMLVGDPFDPRGMLPAGDQQAVALTPAGEQMRISAGQPIELREVGFYELRDERGSNRLTTLAVNVDPSESELSAFDPEEMRTALAAASTGDARSASGLGLTLAERERQQNGWWYILIAVFLVLIAETLFSNREGRLAGWFGRSRGGKDSGNPGLAA
jgi:hypothetical protein